MSPRASACDAANQRRFLLAMLAAALAYCVAAAAVRWRAELPPVLPWVCIAVEAALALLAVRRYMIYLRETDELVRKVEIEALAAGFGAGAVAAFLLPLLGHLGVPWLDSRDVALVLMVGWAAGSFFGHRRYRVGAPE